MMRRIDVYKSYFSLSMLTCLLAASFWGCKPVKPDLMTALLTFEPALKSSPTATRSLTETATPTNTNALTPTPTRAASSSPSPTPTEDPLDWLSFTRLGDYLHIQPVESKDLEITGWQMYTFDPTECGCIFGEEFFVLIRPGRDPGKTVFWMNGGGACWPGQEACANHFNLDRWSAESKLATQDERNPVRDWNFIFVPSCDGSFYLGDNQADYSGDGKIDHTHWGLRNTSAASALVRKLFPDSQKILIAGCSAGGYGTLVAAPLLRLQFPQASLYVYNESGPGLFNPAQTETWAQLMEAWGLDAVLPEGCPGCRNQLISLYPWMLGNDPNLRVGLFSSYQDSVIGNIYLGMSPPAFENLLMDSSELIHDQYSETFKRFFVKGSSHCVTDYNFRLRGVSVFEWIAALVSEGDDWDDLLE
jgi:hypothetical protein